ncbi:MAG: spore maturation protein [Bacillota bacterium]|jgi:spore maturation protein A
MLHYIWVGMFVSGFIAALAQGKLDILTQAVFSGAEKAIGIIIGLISVLIFWLGLMKLAEKSGLLQKLTRLLGPLVRWLFPGLAKDHPAQSYILSNLSANLLGLGNAATPLGIKAMQELQKNNPCKDQATPEMCTLLALNNSSITILPTLVVGLRLKYQAQAPTDIVLSTFLVTIIATVIAITLDKFYRVRAV